MEKDPREVVDSKKDMMRTIMEDAIEQMYALGYIEGVKDASTSVEAAQIKAAAKVASMMLHSQTTIEELIREVEGDEQS